MATTETTVRIVARPMRHRDDAYFDGVRPEDEDYGRVRLVRITTTTRYSAESTGRRSGRNRLSEESVEEVVAENLDADAVSALMAGLTRALSTSLTVRPGRRGC